MLVIIFIGTLLLLNTQGCLISAQEIGYCGKNPFSSDDFCTKDVDNYICLPAHNQTWSEYNAFYKDAQIQILVLSNLQKQLNSQYLDSGNMQISNNPDCYQAYRKFTCSWNFPKCTANNISKPVCLSICNTFQLACGGSSDVCSIIYAKTDNGLDSSC